MLGPPVSKADGPQAKAKLPTAPSPLPDHLLRFADGGSPAPSKKGLSRQGGACCLAPLAGSPGDQGTSMATGRLRTAGCTEGERATGRGHRGDRGPPPSNFTSEGYGQRPGPFPTSSIRSQQHRRDSRAHPSLTPHVLPTQHRLTLLETDRPFLLQNQDVKTQENDGPGPALFRAMSLFV